MAVLTVGEILKLVIVERLFKLCRYKLLKIPLFAWSYGLWRQGVDWVRSMEAWQTARRAALKIKLFLHDHFGPQELSTYRRFIWRLRITRTRVQRLDSDDMLSQREPPAWLMEEDGSTGPRSGRTGEPSG